MGTLAWGMGTAGRQVLTSTSGCASTWLLPGPEPSLPTSSRLCVTDDITSWVRDRCWRQSMYFLYTPQGIQWEVGDFQPDPTYVPNRGETRVWITG